jgi:hypothetical protein
MHFWLDNLIYIAGVVDKLSFPVAGFAGATVKWESRNSFRLEMGFELMYN